jgi:hypothetical protein
LAVTVVAVGLLLASRLPWFAGTRSVVEAEAVIALFAPALVPLSSRHWLWLAGELTIAMATFALASAWGGRPAYRWAAAAMAIPVTWCWLLAAGVHLLEAYTWPAALALAMIGYYGAPRRPVRAHPPSSPGGEDAPALPSSWLAFAPSVVVALGPSTVLALRAHSAGRPVCVIVLALGTVVCGARWRLQAPVLLGAATLVVFGAQGIFPLIAQAPLWAALAVAGAVLVWLGATAERRMMDLKKVVAGFRDFH